MKLIEVTEAFAAEDARGSEPTLVMKSTSLIGLRGLPSTGGYPDAGLLVVGSLLA